MNKQELVQTVAKQTGVADAVARRVVDATFATVAKVVKKRDSVRVTGFGTFGARRRAARVGRNPATGASMKIAAHWVPTFKAGKDLKAVK